MVKETTTRKNPLDEFSEAFEKFIIDLGEKALASASDQDEKAIIKAFHPSLVEQVKQLNSYTKSAYATASKNQKSEAEKVLKMSSAIPLAKSAQGLLGSIGSALGKLGISKILKELKKIKDMIFEALGISLPPWLDTLLLLIDEIADSIFGAGSAKIAAALSVQEQNYLAELTQLSKLKHAKQYRYADFDDDDF